MLTILLTAVLAAPNPARNEKPSAEGLRVLVRATEAPAPPQRVDPALTPKNSLTGTEFPVLKEIDGRVLIRNKGEDVWIAREDIMTPKEAIRFYDEYLKTHPQVTYFVRRAKAHELDGDWDAAIKDYDEAIRQSPQTSAYWNNRANYYSRKRDYEQAIKGYEEAVRLSPTSYIPLGNHANAFLNQREWDKALEGYDRALKVNPKYARSYAGKATAYREKRLFKEALEESERAMELDPDSPHSFLSRGLTLAAMNEQDRALADFEEAIRYDPLFAAAYYGRAGVFISRKQFQPAIRDLDTAMRLYPNYSSAMVRRAEAWLGCNNPQRAIADLDEAIAAHDSDPVAYREKAWLLATQMNKALRNGKLALELANKARELSKTETPEYWETLAAAHAEVGDFAEAIEWQKKAVADADYLKEKGEAVTKRLANYESKKPLRE